MRFWTTPDSLIQAPQPLALHPALLLFAKTTGNLTAATFAVDRALTPGQIASIHALHCFEDSGLVGSQGATRCGWHAWKCSLSLTSRHLNTLSPLLLRDKVRLARLEMRVIG